MSMIKRAGFSISTNFLLPCINRLVFIRHIFHALDAARFFFGIKRFKMNLKIHFFIHFDNI